MFMSVLPMQPPEETRRYHDHSASRSMIVSSTDLTLRTHKIGRSGGLPNHANLLDLAHACATVAGTVEAVWVERLRLKKGFRVCLDVARPKACWLEAVKPNALISTCNTTYILTHRGQSCWKTNPLRKTSHSADNIRIFEALRTVKTKGSSTSMHHDSHAKPINTRRTSCRSPVKKRGNKKTTTCIACRGNPSTASTTRKKKLRSVFPPNPSKKTQMMS